MSFSLKSINFHVFSRKTFKKYLKLLNNEESQDPLPVQLSPNLGQLKSNSPQTINNNISYCSNIKDKLNEHIRATLQKYERILTLEEKTVNLSPQHALNSALLNRRNSNINKAFKEKLFFSNFPIFSIKSLILSIFSQ